MPEPATPGPSPNKALSIILQRRRESKTSERSIYSNHLLFFLFPRGVSALCRPETDTLSKPKLSSDARNLIEGAVAPLGGTFALKIDRTECEYKNDGKGVRGSCGVGGVCLSVLERTLGCRCIRWGIMRLARGGWCIVSGRGEGEEIHSLDDVRQCIFPSCGLAFSSPTCALSLCLVWILVSTAG